MEQRRLPVFAERFSKLRGEMTQDEFAKYLGISRPTVGFYENGTRLPDALVLRQIAKKCNVSADWLLGLSDANSNSSDIQSVCKFTGLTEGAINRILDLQKTEDFLGNDNVMSIAQVLSRIIEEPCFAPMMEDLQFFFDALYHVTLDDGVYGPYSLESEKAKRLLEELRAESGKYLRIMTHYDIVRFYKNSVKTFWEMLLEETEETYRDFVKEESNNGKPQNND